MLLPVAPVDQVIVPPADGDLLKVVEAPLHNRVPALLLTVGADGVDPVVITTVLLATELPQLATSIQ